MPILVDHSGYSNDKCNPREKLATDLLLSLELSELTLKMPHSRITRSRYSSSPPTKSWPRLIAKTYNKNAVGAFAGIFDKPLTSNIRCGNTVMTFHEFVEFRHEPENECHHYRVNLKEYFKLDDISKIKSLEISKDECEELKIAGPATIMGSTKEDLPKIVYTCVKHGCIVPCPCYLCNDEDPDECEHVILHPGFFDPRLHLFTVRNADSYDINWNEDDLESGNRFCTNRNCRGCVVTHCPPQRGFDYRLSCEKVPMTCCCVDCPYCKSLDILKYAGTEQSCKSCCMKLLQHESYHMVYHFMCLFCMESLNKFNDILDEKEYWDELENTRFEESISCQYCNRLFFDKQKKKRHIEIVHKQNPDFLYSCNDCSKAYGSKQALRYHMDRIHEEVDLEIPCDICEKTFRMEQNLDEHMREVHRNLKYDCHLCPAGFKRQSNLNHHYKVKHNIILNNFYLNSNPEIFEYFECDQCDHKTREKRTLTHHIKFVHHKNEQPVLSCDMCNFCTIEKKTLNHHKKTKHAENEQPVLSCDMCNFCTISRKTLNHHKKTKHAEEQRVGYECRECDFVTNEKKTLNRHQKAKHEVFEQLYDCNQCSFKTSRKDTLTNHIKVIHDKNRQSVLACDLCNFETIQKKTLNRHKKNVHKEEQKVQGHVSKSMTCDRCEYKTNNKNIMEHHKKAMHNSKAYNCQTCEFRTIDEDLLRKHVSSEHLECNHCNFRTTLPQALHTHQKMHGLNSRKRKSITCLFED